MLETVHELLSPSGDRPHLRFIEYIFTSCHWWHLNSQTPVCYLRTWPTQYWLFSKLFLIQTYRLLFAIKGAVAMVRLHQLYVTLSKRFLCWNPSTLYSAHLDPGNRTLLHRCQHVMAFLSADEYKKNVLKLWLYKTRYILTCVDIPFHCNYCALCAVIKLSKSSFQMSFSRIKLICRKVKCRIYWKYLRKNSYLHEWQHPSQDHRFL